MTFHFEYRVLLSEEIEELTLLSTKLQHICNILEEFGNIS